MAISITLVVLNLLLGWAGIMWWSTWLAAVNFFVAGMLFSNVMGGRLV